MNLQVPSSFKKEQEEEIKKKIINLRNELLEWEHTHNCTIIPVLSSNVYSIYADIKVIPNDMIKGDR